MAIAYVQSASATGVAGAYYTNTKPVTISPVAGNLLVLTVVNGGIVNGTTVTDSKGQTWTKALDVITAESKHLAMYYAMNIGSGSTTITPSAVDGVGAANYVSWAVIVQEFSGVALSAALDVSASALDSGYVQSHSAGPTATTAQANELVVVGYASGVDSQTVATPTFTAGSGYSNMVSQLGGGTTTSDRTYLSAAMQSKVVSATGTQSGSLTTNAFDKGAVG
jgi:hypothetical protein